MEVTAQRQFGAAAAYASCLGPVKRRHYAAISFCARAWQAWS